MNIGQFGLSGQVILAPMAGVTDQPFRILCRDMGAAMVVSEMVSANPALRQTRKTQWRMNHDGEREPISVQIAGGDPDVLAEAARSNVETGAQIIDINMGCPAKKVCHKAAGSALLRDEKLVGQILDAVVKAVSVPVTLKIRTGWDRTSNNAVAVAKMAENAGIQALAIHGRSRCDFYQGEAEYDTIRDVKSRINIPVIANGDIEDGPHAKYVLDYTGADAVMIGRGAQGKPWIFDEINYFLTHGIEREPLPLVQVRDILLRHLYRLYEFYGEYMGVRIARKHVAWYLKTQDDSREFRRQFNDVSSADVQIGLVESYCLSA